MNAEIFSVKDAVSARFLEPFNAPTVEYAKRQFTYSVNKTGHQFNEFPEDYTLYHVGTYDQVEGKIVAIDPERVCSAEDVKEAVTIHYLHPNKAYELGLPTEGMIKITTETPVNA